MLKGPLDKMFDKQTEGGRVELLWTKTKRKIRKLSEMKTDENDVLYALKK